jgi:hypothetical protein
MTNELLSLQRFVIMELRYWSFIIFHTAEHFARLAVLFRQLLRHACYAEQTMVHD